MGVDFGLSSYESTGVGLSYSGFNDFRKKVCKTIGIPLPQYMVSLGPDDDNIMILLNHSDCDGEIDSDECGLLYPRLQEIVDQWDKNNYYYDWGLRFIEVLKRAKEEDKDLVFR